MKQLNFFKSFFIFSIILSFSSAAAVSIPSNSKTTAPVNFNYTFGEKPIGGKEIYIPIELKNNDFNADDSEWSYQRSASSDNIIIFWAKGFGQYPDKAPNTKLCVDINNTLAKAEKYYSYYRDTMKFVVKGKSKTDQYRMIIILRYQEEWLATGAGYDNTIGALWVNPWALRTDSALAHEFGHTFQYQTACDGNYGFRDQNYVGQFWEQCAQFMSWQINNSSFTREIPHFLENVHKHFSHEDYRYQSMYLMEFWKQKHGIDFLGKLWRGAKVPEHPLQTYKRITGINQEQLNDEFFEYACKNIAWDYPLGVHNKSFIKGLSSVDQKKHRHHTTLEVADNGYYKIANKQIPHIYGYNAIQLSVPKSGTKVTVDFEGLNGQWSSIEGWRYGFVVINENDTAIYGKMRKAKQGTAKIMTPQGAKELWLVVTGAPSEHRNHVWDDKPDNDENFPYKVKFTNTTIQ
ncbi:DUF6055 domain-containing protein [Flavobacterium sp. GSA192]|uniref:DUF6055 domain-containing protein n=1 Tax=Flavobacterium sp. GSA192 TaxID=2576304 RepID=UPI0011276A30|nr:DUF6055 domain-containing protein [Flavobacterium sp. GSA192]